MYSQCSKHKPLFIPRVIHISFNLSQISILHTLYTYTTSPLHVPSFVVCSHAACLMSFLTCYDCYTRCHVAIHVHTLSYVHVLHASFVLLLSFVSCHSPYCLTSVTPSPDEQHVIDLMLSPLRLRPPCVCVGCTVVQARQKPAQ